MNIFPFKSHDTSSEAYLSFRNSMLLMRLNVSSSTMYDRLAAGMMSRGNGTLFHCTPPFSDTSSLPQLFSQKRLYTDASVKL